MNGEPESAPCDSKSQWECREGQVDAESLVAQMAASALRDELYQRYARRNDSTYSGADARAGTSGVVCVSWRDEAHQSRVPMAPEIFGI